VLSDSRSTCPNEDCDSSDGFAEDLDKGGGYCFACAQHWKGDGMDTDSRPTTTSKPVKKERPAMDMSGYQAMPIPDRKLKLATCRRYSILSEASSGNYAYAYRDEGGNVHCHKIRTPDKKFPTSPTGVIQESMLFGQHAFPEGGPSVTITEGEFDAPSVFEMMGEKYAAVSVQSSSTAYRDCTYNWEYLNSFRKIIICFDSDDAGSKAAAKVAQLFPGKAHVMTMNKHNDPSDYHRARDSKEFEKEWWASKEVAVGGFLQGSALLQEMGQPVAEGVTLPWPELTKAMYGVRWHELITLGAGSGMGKTEVFKEFIYHFIRGTDERPEGYKCGVIFLEERPALTGLCIHGKSLATRLQKPEYTSTRMKMVEEGSEFKQISDNLVVVDHKGESELKDILSKIEYLVVKYGCKFIFLDHITAICEGNEDGSNVNSILHYAMDQLNKLLQRHEFTLFMISHLNQPSGTPHEEGARVTLRNFYGSGAIKQRSNFVMALEGNQQAEGEARNYRHLRVLKDRNTGEATGIVVDLKYDVDTGLLDEYDIDEEIDDMDTS
jgi:twinkle protein